MIGSRTLNTGPLEQTNRSSEDGYAADPLTHAWNWFKYHAEQRMIIVRFYLIVIGALGAGYITVLNQKENFLAAVVALFGCVVSILFAILDRRTWQLIEASKAAYRSSRARWRRRRASRR
jgi:hypothetical protein